MKPFLFFLLALFGLSLQATGQQRTVAITVDDLPYVGRTGVVTDAVLPVAEARLAREVNQKLLKAFKKGGVPVTGFVNGKRGSWA